LLHVQEKDEPEADDPHGWELPFVVFLIVTEAFAPFGFAPALTVIVPPLALAVTVGVPIGPKVTALTVVATQDSMPAADLTPLQ